MNKALTNKTSPYLWIALVIFLGYAAVWQLIPQRVGDGSEYYALFYSWLHTHRPWMSLPAFDAYGNLVDQGYITGLVTKESLFNAFPSLRLGHSSDFNHFWFYSLLAFICNKIFSIVGFNLNPHQSFLALHFLLLLVTSFAIFYYFRWAGIITFYIMTFASPMLWFFDKVHTELFTYCITLVAIVLIIKKKYLASAFMLAAASTQNPSFAIISLIPFAYRYIGLRKVRFTFIEAALSIGTTLLVALHPIYYFFRFGTPTPQLLAGGASLGGNLSNFYIWIIDPDIGLLPNWPIGCIFLLIGLFFLVSQRNNLAAQTNRFLLFFLLAFFAINFYAHSSTTNINSGATSGVARYALWYLPLFFLPIVFIVQKLIKNVYGNIFLILIVIIFSIFNIYDNNPKKNESYTTPTKLSLFIQKNLSSLYIPPSEVFAERYSGLGEMVSNNNIRGIIGPDCKRILIYPGAEKSGLITSASCLFDLKKLETELAYIDYKGKSTPFFIKINNATVENNTISLGRGEYPIGSGLQGNAVLGAGWYKPESWGVWSNGNQAIISFPCSKEQFYAKEKRLNVDLYIQPFTKQNISIKNAGNIVFKDEINISKMITFSGDIANCRNNRIEFEIAISNPTSPLEIGQSSDVRKLGIAIMKFKVY